jgi:hypothetical protein
MFLCCILTFVLIRLRIFTFYEVVVGETGMYVCIYFYTHTQRERERERERETHTHTHTHTHTQK